MGKIKKRTVITDRDMDIFRLLSSGPATFIQIKLLMERIYKRAMSEGVLWVRLSKLKASGYLDSCRYAGRTESGRFSLYSLTSLSKEVLVKAGYPAGSLRAVLPDEFSVHREMLVTDAVRAIKREGSRRYEYQLTDRDALERAAKGRAKSAPYYPDLRIRVILPAEARQRARIYDIEVDSSILLPAEVIAEIRQLEYPPLVLCAERQRIDALRRACAAFGSADLAERALFGLISEFTRDGLSGTQWVNAKGELVRIIAQEEDTRYHPGAAQPS